MPLRRNNTRTFIRTLYSGQTETIKLYKRGDDMRQSQVTIYTLFNVRRSVITKTKETIQGDEQADRRATWHIPRNELDRVGVKYINPLDRILQIQAPEAGVWWEPEGTTLITYKLFGNEVHIDCLSVNPPLNA